MLTASRWLLATVPLAAGLFIGPPSIKVTLVTNKALAPTAGAVLDVTAHHHVESEPINITGKIEGLSGGRRVSRPLTITPTSTRGRFGVAPQWEAGKPWVLVLSTDMADHGIAVALVKVASDGKITATESPNSLRAIGKPLPPDAIENAVKEALTSLGAK